MFIAINMGARGIMGPSSPPPLYMVWWEWDSWITIGIGRTLLKRYAIFEL